MALQHIYRSLNILADGKKRIEAHIFQRYRHLFNQREEVVFYDVTTFYFESVRAGEFRHFGFGKTGMMNEVQEVMGLLLGRCSCLNFLPFLDTPENLWYEYSSL